MIAFRVTGDTAAFLKGLSLVTLASSSHAFDYHHALTSHRFQFFLLSYTFHLSLDLRFGHANPAEYRIMFGPEVARQEGPPQGDSLTSFDGQVFIASLPPLVLASFAIMRLATLVIPRAGRV